VGGSHCVFSGVSSDDNNNSSGTANEESSLSLFWAVGHTDAFLKSLVDLVKHLD
jgi:hypothetical protein